MNIEELQLAIAREIAIVRQASTEAVPRFVDRLAAGRIMELLKKLAAQPPKYKPATCPECGSERPYHWMSCSHYQKHF